MKVLPQEIEVWYLLPALRREIAKTLKERGWSQRKIASFLDITPAAVNQYLKEKRGNEKVPKGLEVLVETYARKMVSDEKLKHYYFFELVKKAKKCGFLCYLHKKHDEVKEGCDMCLKTI